MMIQFNQLVDLDNFHFLFKKKIMIINYQMKVDMKIGMKDFIIILKKYLKIKNKILILDIIIVMILK